MPFWIFYNDPARMRGEPCFDFRSAAQALPKNSVVCGVISDPLNDVEKFEFLDPPHFVSPFQEISWNRLVSALRSGDGFSWNEEAGNFIETSCLYEDGVPRWD